jgi:hypothetical protein
MLASFRVKLLYRPAPRRWFRGAHITDCSVAKLSKTSIGEILAQRSSVHLHCKADF